MATLYRERHLSDEVVFDWKAASSKVSQDELITWLEGDMIRTIQHLETMTDSEEREMELKKIEFLRVSIVRARLGREMISLVFPINDDAPGAIAIPRRAKEGVEKSSERSEFATRSGDVQRSTLGTGVAKSGRAVLLRRPPKWVKAKKA